MIEVSGIAHAPPFNDHAVAQAGAHGLEEHAARGSVSEKLSQVARGR